MHGLLGIHALLTEVLGISLKLEVIGLIGMQGFLYLLVEIVVGYFEHFHHPLQGILHFPKPHRVTVIRNL